jgi:hypothetical protein
MDSQPISQTPDYTGQNANYKCPAMRLALIKRLHAAAATQASLIHSVKAGNQLQESIRYANMAAATLAANASFQAGISCTEKLDAALQARNRRLHQFEWAVGLLNGGLNFLSGRMVGLNAPEANASSGLSAISRYPTPAEPFGPRRVRSS